MNPYHPKFRKLWIDDYRDPAKNFVPDPENWLWAKNYAMAEGLLTHYSWDVVSFDHDLAPQHYRQELHQMKQTGYDLACICEEGAFKGTMQRFEWFVHSQNPQGAERIRRALTKANEFWSQK